MYPDFSKKTEKSHHHHAHSDHNMYSKDNNNAEGQQEANQHGQNGDHHDHPGHGPGAHHGHTHMVEDFKKRFFISLFITIPILILSPMIQNFLGVDWRFSGDLYVLALLASIVYFYGGWPFLKGVKDELQNRNPGMMTLIALAISIAYIYSVAILFGAPGHELFWELATLVTIMLLGHWIEMRSILGASRALEELVKIMPAEAHLIDENGDVQDVPVSQLKMGHHILIKPGEKIAADGLIIKGSSTVDESMLTGESVPVEKGVEGQVIGGAINGEGSLTIKIQKTGEESYLSQVIKMVKEAQEARSKTQDLANRAAKLLFYVALIAGGSTFIIWTSLGHEVSFAIERMVTVMVIACPHALGLATPLVVAVSTSISARQGLLIRNRTNFEEARKLNAVVFDKTGTLTKGEFGITDIVITGERDEKEILSFAAALESQSEHPIAKGIVKDAKSRGIKMKTPETFSSMTGKGLAGVVDGEEVKVVSPGFITDQNIIYPEDQFRELSNQGKTVVFVLIGDKLQAMIALADQIRESSKRAIERLKDMGVQSMMLTGDNRQVATWVGDQLGLDQIFAEVLPHEKADKIKHIQDQGLKVAMTGDGVNDAPALATADLGIAIGAGTDVAIETADIILVRSNPEDVVSILELSKRTYRKMIQNLWWATGYNVVAIPLAAGALFAYGVLLTPAVGAVFMSLSTIIVAINAKLLKA